ncbi:MAG TPA: HAMP domain-containing sensor histidine kinase [Rhizobiaceae bacterium]|nr:HAMP domain-containing sensor histidine kinase [Rhizobiaceae bacterium]
MADAAAETRAVPLARGLSTKLLVLTALFVLLAEVLIFLPAIANYRLTWLEERLNTAAAVGVVLLQTDPLSLSREAQDDILKSLGAKAIAVREEGGVSRLLVVAEMPPTVDEHIDLAATEMAGALADAIDTMIFGGGRMLRVFGPVGDSTKEFELVIQDKKLRKAMLAFSRNVALLSLLISAITAAFVFWAINRIMIRPVRDMTRSMLDFSEAPDDPARIIEPEDRADELGVAERELASMQTRLQRLLGEQKHLADLGLAVSKINHDMRNILASAQLLSDRLRSIRDPAVQAFAPKLLRALDRAVSYSENVLAYGRAHEPAPVRRRVRLRELVDEVYGLLGIDASTGIEFENHVEPGFEIDADSEQLFRVLTNLGRNALQAMTADKGIAVVRRLTVSAERTGTVARIDVADTGPGLPQKARENLFTAFRGSARSGGIGLGLAIAHELVRAHGGTLELVESVGGHTVFAITIPDQPVNFEQVRTALRRPAE